MYPQINAIKFLFSLTVIFLPCYMPACSVLLTPQESLFCRCHFPVGLRHSFFNLYLFLFPLQDAGFATREFIAPYTLRNAPLLCTLTHRVGGGTPLGK